jgi:hypothetical protein
MCTSAVHRVPSGLWQSLSPGSLNTGARSPTARAHARAGIRPMKHRRPSAPGPHVLPPCNYRGWQPAYGLPARVVVDQEAWYALDLTPRQGRGHPAGRMEWRDLGRAEPSAPDRGGGCRAMRAMTGRPASLLGRGEWTADRRQCLAATSTARWSASSGNGSRRRQRVLVEVADMPHQLPL